MTTTRTIFSPRRVIQLSLGEFRASPWRTALTFALGKPIVVGRNFRVKGANHIDIKRGRLMLGTTLYGYADPSLGGLLRVEGKLEINGAVIITHGNRWRIGPGATVAIGDGSYFGPMTRVLISSGLTIGERCGIAWDCQFLDDDKHSLSVTGVVPRPRREPIVIGDHVWIASRSTILKGTRIGSGCVVASGATVRGDFSDPGCLIGGTPAKVIRRGMIWDYEVPPT